MNVYGWSAIASMLIFTIVGSLAYKFVQNKVESFYVMDRQAPALFVCGTFIASWLSMATFIGAMAMAWRWGTANEMWFYGSLWGITMFTFLIAIPLRRGGYITVPEFFGDLYNNNKLRTLTVVVLLISQMGIMVLQIMGAGKALEMAIGVPYWVGVVAFGALVGVYVTLGGMYAVVITDTLMLVTFVVATFVAFPYTLNSLGGWQAITHTLPAIKPGIWNWNGADSLPFFYLFGIFITWFAGAGASPYLVSRAYVAKDEKALVSGLVGGQTLSMIFLWMIFIMAAGVNLVKSDFVDPDFVGPWWAMNLVPVWVGCLIFAGIMASGISTLNTLAMTVGQGIGRDIFHRTLKPDAKDRSVVTVTRVTILLASAIAIIGALLKPALVAFVGLWAAAIFACTYLPGILLSLYDKKVTSTGVFWGIVAGMAFYIPLSVYESKTGAIDFTTTYIFPVVIWATIIATIVMLIVSRLTSPSKNEIATRANLMQKMFPFNRVLGIQLDRPISSVDYIVPVVCIIGTMIFGIYLTIRLIS